MSGVHTLARRLWNDELGAAGAVLSAALIPAELLYRAAAGARNRAFDRGLLRSRRATVPVISVGNIAVGGAGKTPFANWLARRLVARGQRPAILHGGYAADEPELHRRWSPDIPVYAGPDRVGSAALAVARGATVLVLDDAFQHRRLRRDADIVLVAAERWGRGLHLLPRGPWREPLAALSRATLVVVTRKTAGADDAQRTAGQIARRAGCPVAVAHLRPARWRSAAGGIVPPSAVPALLVSAVAEPALLAASTRAAGATLAAELIFADHHEYSEADARGILAAAAGRPIMTTEKDWTKLERWLSDADVRILEQDVVLEHGEQALDEVVGSTVS